jgi:hypothetical protein
MDIVSTASCDSKTASENNLNSPQSNRTKPAPPPGAFIYYQDQHSRACDRRHAATWTYAGAKQWFSVTEITPPEKPSAQIAAEKEDRKTHSASRNGIPTKQRPQSEMTEVGPDNPCPVCSKENACKITDDGLIVCFRHQGEVSGFRYLGADKKSGVCGLYRREGEGQTEPKSNGKPRTENEHSGQSSVNWEHAAKIYAVNLTPARRNELANHLGLPLSCLDAIDLIGCSSDQEGDYWLFPERDGQGDIVGLQRRYCHTGEKKAMAGSGRGLTIPCGWNNADKAGTAIYIVEGASDVLALTSIGWTVIGRPSAKAGAEQIAKLLESAGITNRQIIVLGERDAKPATGQWPGRDGAMQVAARLDAILNQGLPAGQNRYNVSWGLPPKAFKDARDWVTGQESEPQRNEIEIVETGQEAGEKIGQSEREENNAPLPDPYQFALIDSKTFAEADYKPEWLVKGVLAKDKPIILGGPRKALKTSVLADLVISLGSGTPFLGQFPIPKKLRVAFLSGESGDHTIQETALRICDAKRVKLQEVDVLWGFDLPQLANSSHMAEVQRGITEHGITFLVIDPLYLCLLAGVGEGTVDAKNLFQMGPLFAQVSKTLLSAGCTPMLSHHTIKRPPNPFEPLDLEDLAYAGVQEFARQWILLSRRERYEPGTGTHKLWIEYGASTGQSGQWGLDIEEGVLGDNFTGRKWGVTVRPMHEVRQDRAEERAARKEEEAAEKTKDRDNAVLKAIDSMTSTNTVATVRQLRGFLGFRPATIEDSLTRLEVARIVETYMATVTSGRGKKENTVAYRRATKHNDRLL